MIEKSSVSHIALLLLAFAGVAWATIGHRSTTIELAAADLRLSHPARPAMALIGRQARTSTQSASSEQVTDPLLPPQVDPFRAISFLPPAPKVIAPVIVVPPPPKPVAPAFPYAYFGRMMDINRKNVTYLTRDDALIPIHQGEVLDNAFRIDEITAAQIVVTYLPLDEKISIATRAANE